MVSKTMKRQKRKEATRSTKASLLIDRIEANVAPTVGAKVRITHRMKHKRKYRIGGASPDDMYARWEAFNNAAHTFECPSCQTVGSVRGFCATCKAREGPSSRAAGSVPQSSDTTAATAAGTAQAAPGATTTRTERATVGLAAVAGPSSSGR
eukprot:TRINITY_DN68163_c0_g1_i1.p2 TRINITY_DN68163_c0_g1~~TRINITY_DN68163_c0_g1_i1.p2  ORF type:complete len:164 (+),score=14.64 TRINITY_DN68163_c0_g1_i1:38-493(+)